MKRFCIKVSTVFLLAVSLFLTSKAFAAGDVRNIAETLVKIYKIDSLANEYLFGSFAATNAEPIADKKFTNNRKKSSSSGFKIKGLKRLQYKIDQNQFVDLRNNRLQYVFKIRF